MDFKTGEINLVIEREQQKAKKNWRLVMFGRRVAVILLLAIQFFLFFFMSWEGARLFAIVNTVFMLCGILLSLFVIQKSDSSGYKLLWVFFFLSVPVFGVTFYFLIRGQGSTKRMKRQYLQVKAQKREALEGLDPAHELSSLGAHERTARYLKKNGGYTLSRGDRVDYFKTGEQGFAKLLEDLESAEKYIFLEYFIVNEGVLWNRVLDVLLRKIDAGVEVRLMMDDMGCFMLRPRHFARELEEMGIRVCVFNKFRPFISAIQNNRDHRKIAVIDGRIAHTGGANIADEYINLRQRFGYWKDTTVRVEGTVAKQFAVMFLSLWDMASQTKETWDTYLVESKVCENSENCGGVIPFSDSPINEEPLCRNLFLSMIQNARRSVYICTPYFLPDETILHALKIATNSGIDVRIIVPYCADKKLVKKAGMTYFSELIRAGVRIYEYTPGFNHAKMILADGEVAYVGSANFDYRSFFLHYECGLFVCGGAMPAALDADFDAMFSESQVVGEPKCRFGYLQKIWHQLLRLFAPLM